MSVDSPQTHVPGSDHLVNDLLRFHQALDQAVAESADFYTKEVDRWRHIFLGMLGHDRATRCKRPGQCHGPRFAWPQPWRIT